MEGVSKALGHSRHYFPTGLKKGREAAPNGTKISHLEPWPGFGSNKRNKRYATAGQSDQSRQNHQNSHEITSVFGPKD